MFRCHLQRAGCKRTQQGLCLLHHVLGEGHVLHGAADVPCGGCPQVQALLHHLPHQHDVSETPFPALGSLVWQQKRVSVLPGMCPRLKTAVWSFGSRFGAF